MPNFFSKTASQNGTLKLFAGGKQVKSLVPLIDALQGVLNLWRKEKIFPQKYSI